MLKLEERLKGVHPNATRWVEPGAKYVSAGLKSYSIRQQSDSLWFIIPYGGSRLPDFLMGTYTSEKAAETKLIQYLKSKDKFGRAVYPTYGES